ncbi:MAG: universal stress protein [Bacteroidetes bacterium]|nr:universal stress protein [Bacteroidota bacterium]
MNEIISLKNILVPVNFSAPSDNALTTAIEMCRRHKAVLHLLHVKNRSFYAAPADAGISVFRIFQDTDSNELEILKHSQETIRDKYHVDVCVHLEQGNLLRVIKNKATELHCGLIVITANDSSVVKKILYGNITDSLVRYSNIPVLTVPPKHKATSFRRILFPVKTGGSVLKKYKTIEAIVEKNSSVLTITRLFLANKKREPGFIEEEMNRLIKVLASKKQTYYLRFHACKNYAKKLLEIADKESPDLIAINTSYEKNNWGNIFFGHFVQQVISHATVPVITIPENIPASIFLRQGRNSGTLSRWINFN